jgi:hypothetical protein
MYAVRLHLRPTGGLTFRVLPGSLLHIATYPFVPPSTLSGFLKRLALLTTQREAPTERGVYPETDVERGRGQTKNNPPYYTMPRTLVPVGAYPRFADHPDAPCRNYRVHQTYRHGPREFRHRDFSKLRKGGTEGNFQLHTWEYLFADYLVGYVLAQKGSELEDFEKLIGYGTKFGKEGYAYLEDVNGPFALSEVNLEAAPSTLVLQATAGLVLNAVTYQVYYHRWREEAPQTGLFERAPSPVDGFNSFLGVFVVNQGQPVGGNYFHDGQELFISKPLVEQIGGIS